MENIFFDIGIIIIFSAIGALIANKTKQPLVLAYILIGIILGPILKIVNNIEFVHILSEIGIAFLLFIVGLELNLKKLKNTGDVAIIGSLIQMVIFFALGFIVGLIFKLDIMTRIYFGIIVMFSSTMVVLKILSDKNELDTVHSRIIIGTLLMQDIVAIIILSLLNQSGTSSTKLIITLFSGLILVFLAYFFGKFIFPSIFRVAAKSPEVLFMISLATCFTGAFLFHLAGFSIAIGAFIAGVTIGNLPYNLEIEVKIKPLRDFFAVLFFTSLGLELVFQDLIFVLPYVLLLLIIVIVLKPILTTLIVASFGYKRRISFLTGINLAQISEFSLIAASQGLVLGQINRPIYTTAIIVALISITTTSYFIKYEQRIYKVFSKHIKRLDKFGKKEKSLNIFDSEKEYNVILCGYNRIGYSIYNTLKKIGKNMIIIDYNPDTIKKLISKNIPCIYGDLNDPEILENLNFKHIDLVISTIPELSANLLILQEVKKKKRNIRVILTAYHIHDALDLYNAGADYVIVPHILGGEHVSLMLERIGDDIDELIKTKLRHINELKIRKELTTKQ